MAACVVFIAFVVRGMSGFGAGMSGIPLIAFVMPVHTAIALFGPTPPRVLLAVFVGAYVLLHVVAFGHHRFHLPLVPVLALFTAAALVEPPAAPTPRRKAAAALLFAGTAAAILRSLLA